MNKKLAFPLIIVALIAATYFGYQAYATHLLKQQLDSSLLKAQSYADIQYHNLSFNPINHKIVLSGITIRPVDNSEVYQINQIVVHKFDQTNKIPKYLSLAVNGIHIEVNELSPAAQKSLKAMGYNNDYLSTNLAIDYAYDKDNKDLYINKLNISIDDMAHISTRLHIGNIDLSDNNAGLALTYLYPSFTVHSAAIDFIDNSFVNRAISLQAKQSGQTEKDVKALIINNLKQTLEHNAFSEQLISAIQSFLDKPTQIALLAEPKKPVLLADIIQASEQNPDSLIALLNLSVKAKP